MFSQLCGQVQPVGRETEDDRQIITSLRVSVRDVRNAIRASKAAIADTRNAIDLCDRLLQWPGPSAQNEHTRPRMNGAP